MRSERLFTTIDAARAIPAPVSPDDIARLARKGLIPATRLGRRWQLTAAAVRQVRHLLDARAAAYQVERARLPRDAARSIKGHRTSARSGQ